MNAIFRWPSLCKCSNASRPPASLSTITELTVSPGRSQPARSFLDFLLGSRRKVPRERCVVQDDRNGGGRKTARLRDVPHRYGNSFAARSFHAAISVASIIRYFRLRLQWWTHDGRAISYSAGISNDSGSRNQRVFQIPNATPTAIQMAPTTLAWLLRFHHSKPQTTNPTIGGIKFPTVYFFSCTKYRMNADAFTPINAISAPKLSSPIPCSNVKKNAPISTITPMKITLFRGT